MTQAVQMGENHNAKTLKIVEDLVKDGQVETSHVEKLVRTCPRTCPCRARQHQHLWQPGDRPAPRSPSWQPSTPAVLI